MVSSDLGGSQDKLGSLIANNVGRGGATPRSGPCYGIGAGNYPFTPM